MDWSHGRNKEEHRGLLWIRGKPGSGKSTLMRTIYENATEIANTNPDMLVVTFFFNARAKYELEKSSIGMYRSIVHQVLDQMPSQWARFTVDYRDKLIRDIIDDWTIPDLQVFLQHVVGDLRGQSLAILLDALDEAEEKDVRALVTFMEDLCRIATENKTNLQVCLSSRHYPFIRIRKGSITLVLESEEEHSRDINNYINNWLSKYHESMPELQVELVKQAKGVFLWVSLAIQQLEYLHDSGDQDAMLERVKHIPSRLDDLFSELLKTNTNDLDETIILFQWMLYARELPHPTVLYSAIKFRSKLQPVPDKINVPNAETVRRFLLSKSMGLVEVVPARNPNDTDEVHFIHETAKSFLLSSKGLPKLQPVLSNNLLGSSHEKLRRICFDYLVGQLITQTSKAPRSDPASNSTSYHPRKSPILEILPPHLNIWWEITTRGNSPDQLLYWSRQNLFYHAEAAENAGVSQNIFLKEISTVAHGSLAKFLSRDQGLATCSVLDLVVAQNNIALTRSIIESSKTSEFRERKEKLLYFAALRGNYGVCEVLLDYTIDPDIYEGFYGSALSVAAYSGHTDIVQLLLDEGADVNLNRGPWGTALIAASENGHLETVELLFEYHADPNLRNSKEVSALDSCIGDFDKLGYHYEIIRLLLQQGAERPSEPYLARKLQGNTHFKNS
jgi:hypothetical protein